MENKTSLRHPIFHHSICFTLQQFNILKEVPLTWFIPLAISFWNRGEIYSFLLWLLLVTPLPYPRGRQEAGNFEKRLLVSRSALTCSLAKPQGTLPSVSSFPTSCPPGGLETQPAVGNLCPDMPWIQVQMNWKAKSNTLLSVFGGATAMLPPDEITFKIPLCLLLCLLHLGKKIV